MSIHCNIYLPITLTILNNHTIYFQTLLAVDGSGVRQRSLPGITLTKWRAARKAPARSRGLAAHDGADGLRWRAREKSDYKRVPGDKHNNGDQPDRQGNYPPRPSDQPEKLGDGQDKRHQAEECERVSVQAQTHVHDPRADESAHPFGFLRLDDMTSGRC